MKRKQFLRSLSALLIGLALVSGSVLTPLHAEPAKKEVTVFAAASLGDAFKVLKKSFETAHPGVTVTYNFAGSQQLRAQVEQGATPDVFASANLDEIKALAAKKYVEETQSKIFARNKLVIAVNAQSEIPVKSPKDLAAAKLKLVLADKSVPVGKYTVKYLDAASKDPAFGASYKDAVLKNVVSYETNVRAVLTKVTLGEADAGVVYATDAQSVETGKLFTISLPAGLSEIAQYPIAPLVKAPNKELAQAFVAYVLSAEGQQVLSKFGFLSNQ
ncbi:MAG: molybdate ABC transporter substrate-binding protein [Verrucomicrobia bacterium Tous-C9LFEB]|nr:MAG: molybdate ABC transporter substrate-binding protein [Verrucomicrobia bacterium Tous-C9LFEB]